MVIWNGPYHVLPARSIPRILSGILKKPMSDELCPGKYMKPAARYLHYLIVVSL